MSIDGVLVYNQSQEFMDVAAHRNAIAHGIRTRTPSPEKFHWLSHDA